MTTGLQVFDASLQKTNELLEKIEKDMGWAGRREQTYKALRVVLHALRDRLTVEDSANFSAQLPVIIKGTYYDGWKPEQVPIKMSKDDFVNRVQSEFQFSIDRDISEMIKIIFNNLFETMGEDESKDLKEKLPQDLYRLIAK